MSIITKSELRRDILMRLRSMSPLEVNRQSDILITKFINSGLLDGINSIMLYYPIAGECNVKWLMDYCVNLGLQVLLPRIDGDNMVIADYNNGMAIGAYGIYEPSGHALDIVPDVIVTPFVAITDDGIRLGRGKGYYDRYLRNYCGNTIGLALSQQLVDYIPNDAHDVRIKRVIAIKEYDNESN